MTKTDSYSIFRRIVESENSLTTLTYNLLQYHEFKELFLEFISPGLKGKYPIGYNDIKTQHYIGVHGRPDMAIVNDNVEILIEIKTTDAEMTENQPSGYLRHLSKVRNDKEKQFYFLIPKKYKHKDKCIGYLDKSNVKNIHKEIKYWDDLLTFIEEKQKITPNDILNEYQLLLKEWFTIKETFFDSNNIKDMESDTMPETLEKIIDVIDSIKDQLKKTFTIKDEKKDKDCINGFNICDNEGDFIFFFGCYLPFWKRTNSPLVLQLMYIEHGYIEDFKNRCKKEGIVVEYLKDEYFDTYYISLSKYLQMKNCNSEILSILNNFMGMVQK